MDETIGQNDSPLRSHVGSLLLMTGIFYLNFISRIIFAPLMPTIERDLGIGHAEAGSFFFLISIGYFVSLMGSGFISSRLTHRKTIILSSIALGTSVIGVSFSNNLWGIRVGCIVVGLSAGLYLPSGISALTAMVRPKDWGKAIAIHELAPNLGLFSAPLVSEALLIWFSWRGILILLGSVAIFIAFAFARLARGGDFEGEPPKPATFKIFFQEPSCWIMIVFFSLGIGGQLGIYAMLPLFLVSERGMTQSMANYLVALSRVLAIGAMFVAGIATDRLGPKAALGGVFIVSGLLTLALGIVPGSWVILTVFLQPLIAGCFFPPGFAALSRVGSPSIRNVLVSFTMPIGFLIGGGAIPTGIGMLGDRGYFGLGISVTGMLLIGGFFLLPYLKFPDGKE
jgi:MFS transporter, NNP family, nitrate/nitrite transporter